MIGCIRRFCPQGQLPANATAGRIDTNPENVRFEPLTSSTTPWLPDDTSFPEADDPFALTVTRSPTRRMSRLLDDPMSFRHLRSWAPLPAPLEVTLTTAHGREVFVHLGDIAPSIEPCDYRPARSQTLAHRTVAWNFCINHGPAATGA